VAYAPSETRCPDSLNSVEAEEQEYFSSVALFSALNRSSGITGNEAAGTVSSLCWPIKKVRSCKGSRTGVASALTEGMELFVDMTMDAKI
jgi:hypothetical protein